MGMQPTTYSSLGIVLRMNAFPEFSRKQPGITETLQKRSQNVSHDKRKLKLIYAWSSINTRLCNGSLVQGNRFLRTLVNCA